MYEIPEYISTQEARLLLGLGRNSVLKLCKNRPHNFPATKVGNKYIIDAKLLMKWRDDLFQGKFEL